MKLSVKCLLVFCLCYGAGGENDGYCEKGELGDSVCGEHLKSKMGSMLEADTPLVFTVASERTDGYLRYLKSAKQYNIDNNVMTLGLNQEWLGGDMKHEGGGYKINLLRKALEPFKDDKEKLILFTDSYDVIFLTPMDEIVRKFKATDARILFAAEHFCWPDKDLQSQYPEVIGRGARYLNSGMFMGYANDVYDLISTPVKDTSDDQLYYTKAYINADKRQKLNLKLDHTSNIFQNLNGATNVVQIEYDAEEKSSYVINSDSKTKPNILHGNGPSKINLNSLANYLSENYKDNVCTTCADENIELNEANLPIVSLAIFVERPVPFFEEFLDKILTVNYPKENIHLFFHNNVNFHKDLVSEFVVKFGGEYKSIKEIKEEHSINERNARELAVEQAIQRKSDFMFVVDADVHLDNPDVLRNLIKSNRRFVAPLVVRASGVWSNFWGALSENGFYARSNDYLDVVNDKVRGVWNVPFISSCYLINKSVFSKLSLKHDHLDPDMALCNNLRNENIFMHITNLESYGHLIDYEDFNTKLTRPNFYQLFANPTDWEQRYIHPEFETHLSENTTNLQPCPDVFWFPVGTEQFADDMVAIMENFGKWSDGSNSDKRLEGGYEAVPTRDIHMTQVGLEPLWLKFLQKYVRPFQEKVFLGYFHNPPRSLMNFVVRYRPDEQPSLRPHHDSSTYTINIALNTAGVDYEGGGCKFLRYNCSVTDTKKGWMLMHPGRLTHYHEGLKTTNGTRYIMISFVDP